MDVHEELDRKWREAALTGRGGREWRGVALSVAAPVRLLAAVREPDDRIALLIETTLSLAPAALLRFETQGLSLADQRRPAENVFRLAITLERNELREVFEALCGDLITVASEAGTPAAAISAVSKRLDAWRVCLRTRKSGLTREEQIGLLGELGLFQVIGKNAGYPVAADTWQGPLDGIHDFAKGGSAIEVKSVLGIGTHIYVSRLDQLETDGLSNLTIARPRFRLGHDGRSLPQTVKALRSDIAVVAPGALAQFDEKLLMAGYIEIDEPLYVTNLFVQESVRYYTVGGGFPRIARHALPVGIVDGTYIVDERSIAGFRQADDQFFQMLNQNFGHHHE
jgi:hypothetical protein